MLAIEFLLGACEAQRADREVDKRRGLGQDFQLTDIGRRSTAGDQQQQPPWLDTDSRTGNSSSSSCRAPIPRRALNKLVAALRIDLVNSTWLPMFEWNICDYLRVARALGMLWNLQIAMSLFVSIKPKPAATAMATATKDYEDTVIASAPAHVAPASKV